MALDFGSVKKPRQQFSGGSESVAVMIAEVHLADPSKKTANPAEDYAIAYLLEDAFGMKAEFNLNVPDTDEHYGSPLTSVKIKMKPRNLSGEYTPMEIFDLQPGKRKGASLPMGQWPTVILERAYLDSRTDTVVVNWLHVAQRDNTNAQERCLTNNLVTVESERYDVRDNERKYRQIRFTASPDRAVTFNDMASFKAAATEMLKENLEQGDGQPLALMRFVTNDSFDEGKVPEIHTRLVYPAYKEGGEGYEEPAVSVERWLADESNKGWVNLINQAATETGYTVELIPLSRYTTGKESLPSKRGKGRDDAESFQIPSEDRENGYAPTRKNNGEGFLMTNGYAAGSMIVKRAADPTARWFATKTLRKTGFGPIYMRDELVTPNLPEKVRNVFESLAAARGEAARARFTNGAQQSQPAQESSHDDEIPFGEPDHSGGLTPS